MLKRPLLLILAGTVAATAACGGSGKAKSASTRPTTSSGALVVNHQSETTTTVKFTPEPPSTAYDEACREFGSFADIFAVHGMDGKDAAGEIGGMVQQATIAKGDGTAKSAKLLTDLIALQTFAQSSAWTGLPQTVTDPRFVTVKGDCVGIIPSDTGTAPTAPPTT